MSEEAAFGWIHNINFYWQNKYYYWAQPYIPGQQVGIPYYNLNGCSEPAIGNGITLEGLAPGEDYDISFYMTRMAAPPVSFPPSTTLQADINGNIILDGTILGYMDCDSMTADFAFFLSLSANRPGNNKLVKSPGAENNDSFTFAISPNPNHGNFSISILNKRNEAKSAFTICIYDLTGRLISRQITSNSNLHYNLPGLSKGCYYISLAEKSTVHFKKLILQ